MLAIFLQYLHAVPLAFISFIITAVVTRNKFAEKINSEIVIVLLLILSSLGFTAGYLIHKSGFEHIELFDPCYCYIVTWVGIVFKLVQNTTSTKTLK